MSSALKRALAWSLVVVMAGAAGRLIQTPSVAQITGIEGIELWTLDLRQRTMQENRRGEDGEVVLVLFDEESVEEWPYLSPFPRGLLADLVEALDQAGARTIALDVYLDRLYPELNALDGGDDRLREAVQQAGNVVLAAPVESGPDGPELGLPHPDFLEGAAGVGAAELPTPFETVRDGLLVVRSGDGLAPSFALAVYAHSQGLDADSLLAASWEGGRVSLPFMPEELGRIPPSWLRGDGGPEFALPFPLRFYGPPSSTQAAEGNGADRGTFRAYSASYVPVLAQFVPEDFEDRIVLLGSGFHQEEQFRSPFYDDRPQGEDEGIYGWTYGVEVHANALQGFLEGRYLHQTGEVANLLLLLLAAAIPAGAVFILGAVAGGVAGILTAAGLAVAALWAFQGGAHLPWGTLWEWEGELLWLPVVAPLFSALFAYVGSTVYVAVVEGREKRFIRGAFGKYVSPAVVDEIAERPELLRLGGERRNLSVLFSDLAGFTALSESLSPEELVSLLNEYLSEMTRVVMEEEGTLDKYIGDAIMAFWNAPKDQADHADRALRCALRMQERLAALNRKWQEEGRSSEPFRVRIGVNTDGVVVGNVGGEDRFDYSAIGDGVNLAARLEPANDTYGTRVMASEFTVESATPGLFRLRELDRVAVKGKTAPVRIFEVVALTDTPMDAEGGRMLEHYDAGFAAYRARKWADAEEHFRQALEAHPEDGPSRLLLERCQGFQTDPPPPDWDFVVQRTSK